MKWSKQVKLAVAALALSSLGAPNAQALEMFGGPNPGAHLNDGLLSKVVVVRRGGYYHGGVYRGPRGGVYRGGTVYRGGAYGRPGYGYHRGYWGGWARPGGYWWPAGGAIAAGAAIGFVTAAVATWATPPQPGLCWYYTDPSQQDGFWDACP